jgi:hypothetical protein
MKQRPRLTPFDILCVGTCAAAAAVQVSRHEFSLAVLALAYGVLLLSDIIKDQKLDDLQRKLDDAELRVAHLEGRLKRLQPRRVE